jgi:3-oxoacyl-[acyl-carrier protein] reductase
MKSLEGQTAVVTGASRGIGRAIAKELAKNGAKIVINYGRSEADAVSLATEIKNEFEGESHLVQFDVSKEEEVQKGFDKIFSLSDKVEILVNNAGIAVDGLMVRMKSEDWDKTMAVNLNSLFYCSKAVTKAMMKQRYGRIVNISSVIGLMGNGGQTAYSASKAAIFGFTKSLAREVGSRGITVNAVAPGYIATDMTKEFKEEQAAQLISSIPLGRMGTAKDVADAVYFLSSPQSSYITGEILSVNGGLYM